MFAQESKKPLINVEVEDETRLPTAVLNKIELILE